MAKKILNVLLAGIVLVLLFIAGSLIFSIVQEDRQRDREAREYQQTQVALYGDLTSLCENASAGGVGDFVIESGARPLILEMGSDKVHSVFQNFPAERIPGSRAEVDLVMCLPAPGEGTRVEIDRCPYNDTEREAVRYRVDADISVIDPASGAVVLTDTLKGGDPPGCPFSIQDRGPDEVVLGGSPTAQTIVAWIELQDLQHTLRDWSEDILSLCESPPAAEGTLLEVADIPKVLILETGTRDLHDWYGELPDDWRAADPDDLDFVICVPPISEEAIETVQTGTCSYLITSGRDIQGGQEIPLYQRIVRAPILDPASGAAVAEVAVQGSPRTQQSLLSGSDCPQSIGGDELDGIYGDYPTGAGFQSAFRQQFMSE